MPAIRYIDLRELKARQDKEREERRQQELEEEKRENARRVAEFYKERRERQIRARAKILFESNKFSSFSAHNQSGKGPKSMEKIPKSVDKAVGQSSKNDQVKPGISVRYGPVDDIKKGGPATNGAVNGVAAKRKSRSSIGNSKSYKEASSESEDDRPLVRIRSSGPIT